MQLNKQQWTQEDIIPFREELMSRSKGEAKSEWEQRIVNTKLPCIAVQSADMGYIIKEIAKGDFLGFIRLNLHSNHSEVVIRGSLICRIKDKALFEEYLTEYLASIDNWAACDCLKPLITAKNTDYYFALAEKYLTMKEIYQRRFGLVLLLKLTKFDGYIGRIVELCKGFYDENEYYVNMALAWLIAECYTKDKAQTEQLFDGEDLSKFVYCKAVSKCCDSFRISQEDKDALKKKRTAKFSE